MTAGPAAGAALSITCRCSSSAACRRETAGTVAGGTGVAGEAATPARGSLACGLELSITTAITDAVTTGSASHAIEVEPDAATAPADVTFNASAHGGVGTPASIWARCFVRPLSKS
jgi:hypothetical protein